MNDIDDIKRKIRRECRPQIKRLVKSAGFSIKNVSVLFKAMCSPQAGFDVKVIGQDTPENRKKVESVLFNFAYNITFVNN